MPIINIAESRDEALEKGTNVRRCEMSTSRDLWLYDTYVGLCISDREHNGYDDSDFYMMIWDNEKECPEEIMFATTRGWTYPCYGSSPDATPEILEKYRLYCEKRDAERKNHYACLKNAEPVEGKIVEVITGKKHFGKTGFIFWRGANKFRTYYRNGYNKPDSSSNQVLGIECDNGVRFFVPAGQTRVVGCDIKSGDAIDGLQFWGRYGF